MEYFVFIDSFNSVSNIPQEVGVNIISTHNSIQEL
jgi:hypothetical protein